MNALAHGLDFKAYVAEAKDRALAVVVRLVQAYTARALQSCATATPPHHRVRGGPRAPHGLPVLVVVALDVSALIAELPPNVARILHALMVTAVTFGSERSRQYSLLSSLRPMLALTAMASNRPQ